MCACVLSLHQQDVALLNSTFGGCICLLICSILCLWLGIFYLVQPHLVLCLLPLVPKEEMEERSGQGVGEGRGSSEDPWSTLPHFRAAGVPGCHILEASWNVLVGLSAPICLELVCSVRPGVLVSAAYCVSLLFAHHFQP